MASEVSICNRALQRLGEEPITDLTDDTVRARACNLAYETLRDAELRAHPWGFARSRAALPALATAPDFEWDLQYQMPTDLLRFWKFEVDAEYEIEGRKILTNAVAPLNIIYFKKETDPVQFDALFSEALSARIAAELSEKITQSSTKRQLATQDYKDIIAEARRVNAIERLPEDEPVDPWIIARR